MDGLSLALVVLAGAAFQAHSFGARTLSQDVLDVVLAVLVLVVLVLVLVSRQETAK